MNIFIVGLGYVGSVVAAGLSQTGYSITGVDIDPEKLENLRCNQSNLDEPGLQDLITQGLKNNNLRFCHPSEISTISNAIVFICVGTPANGDGHVNLSYVADALAWIKEKARPPIIIVMKSTVPPGTGSYIMQTFLINGLKECAYIMNPEFLREGQALHDWFHPDRTVIGSSSEQAVKQLCELYKGIEAPVVTTDVTTAEIIKYSANAFLATRISFINGIARLCDGLGANIDLVTRGIGMDKRIGSSYLRAGIGYGGACLPKDIQALKTTFEDNRISSDLFKAVIEINKQQPLLAVDKLRVMLGGLKGKRVTVLGLAFKPGIYDIRQSPSLDIIKLLCQNQAEVHIYGPSVMKAVKYLPPEVKYHLSALKALTGAQGAILATEWEEFLKMDWQQAKTLMKEPWAVVDGRNCLNPSHLAQLGFKYAGFGRPTVKRDQEISKRNENRY
jgi:UDPglucose 6-dehydrogenase